MNELARDFWRSRAEEATESVRWSPPTMLSCDVDAIRRIGGLTPSSTWLDVGCGSGDLQRALSGQYSFALGIDAEPTMGRLYPTDTRTAFLAVEATMLVGEGSFDLVSAFGLITYMSLDDEWTLYRRMKSMARPTGRVLVKNQVSLDDEVVIDTWSRDLNARYWGRYPSLEEQADRLKSLFTLVEHHRYPASLNIREGMAHVAFCCSNS